MSDLFGNHIVGFPTRRLICECTILATSLENLLFTNSHCKNKTEISCMVIKVVFDVGDAFRWCPSYVRLFVCRASSMLTTEPVM